MGICGVVAQTSVRSATKRDVRQVLKIDRVSFSEQWDYDTFVSALQDIFFVCEEKKILRKILGFVVTRYSEDGQGAMIRKIAVHPRHRNKRIGTRLMEAVLDQLRESNVREVDLQVHIANTGAVKLYERFEFTMVRIERPKYGKGEEYYLMRLKLGNPTC